MWHCPNSCGYDGIECGFILVLVGMMALGCDFVLILTVMIELKPALLWDFVRRN